MENSWRERIKMSINIYIYLYAVFEKLRKSVFGGGYPSVFIGVLLKENMVERESLWKNQPT